MAFLISVMALGLLGMVIYCVYLHGRLMDEKTRRYEAEAYIAPVAFDHFGDMIREDELLRAVDKITGDDVKQAGDVSAAFRDVTEQYLKKGAK